MLYNTQLAISPERERERERICVMLHNMQNKGLPFNLFQNIINKLFVSCYNLKSSEQLNRVNFNKFLPAQTISQNLKLWLFMIRLTADNEIV